MHALTVSGKKVQQLCQIGTDGDKLPFTTPVV